MKGMEMSFQGHIENGAVVLHQPVSLPNGTPVRVEVISSPKTLAERFKSIIGAAVDLPDDMAKNHDHYLHDRPVATTEAKQA
jgi:hypothetical protein